ncbi:helix-turn-helix domain-containing protein [Neisseria iguanae]|uniref:XRE family transcriptional regulator n=1 Tax=Neisseria iguanae TaxID=90242 RepID=A0A2P7U1F4_9NEIS|nr:XRE family transcriptional regulator [Neisseria iguanae]PSJ80806.1 XRE family transcriptional regulator [Neisseria iguanae]
MSDLNLANTVKTLRQKNGLTLKELSQRSGISTATLSKIEHGRLSPTYEKIAALAKGLAIEVGELFRADPVMPMLGRRSVTRKGCGVIHHTKQYLYELLNADLEHKRFTPMVATLKAHERTEFSKLHSHDSEEFFYVLSGKVMLITEFYTPLELSPGDSCYFDSTMGHACLSAGDEEARILWISYTFTGKQSD